jgi:hypothetical protein
VIGDAEAGMSQLHGGLGHDLNRLGAVAPGGVHLKVAAIVGSVHDPFFRGSDQRFGHDGVTQIAVAEGTLLFDQRWLS